MNRDVPASHPCASLRGRIGTARGAEKGVAMATKASAIAYRESWARDLDRMERGRIDPEWSADEKAETLRVQRAIIRRELAALRDLPDDAPEADVKRACGYQACCDHFHGSHDVRCPKHRGHR